MQKERLPTMLILIILTATTVFIWVIFEVIRNATKAPDVGVSNQALSPFSPNIDIKVLDQLRERIYVTEDEFDEKLIIKEKPSSPTSIPKNEGE